MKEARMTDYVSNLPSVKKNELEKCYEHLAQWFYETGTPFYRVENEHLLKAFQALRPDIASLPSRVQLGGTMLDKLYNKLKAQVDKRLKSEHYVTGGTDGWSDVNQEPIINHMEIGRSAVI